MAPPVPITPPPVQRRVVAQGSEPDVDLEAAHALLGRLEGERQSGHTLRISLSWVIEADGAGS
jgi:hypothetical protein